MKKIFFSIFICFPVLLMGQNKIKFGVLAGPNYFNFRSNQFFDKTEPKLGFLVGASLEYKLGNKVSLKSNLNLELKNTSSDYTLDRSYYFVNEFGEIVYQPNFYDVNSNYKYIYLTLPVFFKYDVGRNNLFYINGGFFVSKLLNEKSKVRIVNKQTGLIIDSNNAFYDDLYDSRHVENINYGFLCGLGKTLEIKGEEFSIELNNYFGPFGDNNSLNSISLILNWIPKI